RARPARRGQPGESAVRPATSRRAGRWIGIGSGKRRGGGGAMSSRDSHDRNELDGRASRDAGRLAGTDAGAPAPLPRPEPSPPRPYQFPAFERTTLENGLGVIVAPVRTLPMVTVMLVCDAGASA